MNVEIGTEAAQFPEKEYIIGIFFAVYSTKKNVMVKIDEKWGSFLSPWLGNEAGYGVGLSYSQGNKPM